MLKRETVILRGCLLWLSQSVEGVCDPQHKLVRFLLIWFLSILLFLPTSKLASQWVDDDGAFYFILISSIGMFHGRNCAGLRCPLVQGWWKLSFPLRLHSSRELCSLCSFFSTVRREKPGCILLITGLAVECLICSVGHREGGKDSCSCW